VNFEFYNSEIRILNLDYNLDYTSTAFYHLFWFIVSICFFLFYVLYICKCEDGHNKDFLKPKKKLPKKLIYNRLVQKF
jgi:hypothetical protein